MSGRRRRRCRRVRRRTRSRVEIPDFSGRRDEIGHLSSSLRGMTDALYTRIEAIERGVEGVVILDGKTPHAVILELFTELGAGTLITR